MLCGSLDDELISGPGGDIPFLLLSGMLLHVHPESMRYLNTNLSTWYMQVVAYTALVHQCSFSYNSPEREIYDRLIYDGTLKAPFAPDF